MDGFIVPDSPSPSTASFCSAKEDDVRELRNAVSSLLMGGGGESFVSSVGNFMTDGDEFFDVETLELFQQHVREFENAKDKQKGAQKLLQSFSELMANHRKTKRAIKAAASRQLVPLVSLP